MAEPKNRKFYDQTYRPQGIFSDVVVDFTQPSFGIVRQCRPLVKVRTRTPSPTLSVATGSSSFHATSFPWISTVVSFFSLTFSKPLLCRYSPYIRLYGVQLTDLLGFFRQC